MAIAFSPAPPIYGPGLNIATFSPCKSQSVFAVRSQQEAAPLLHHAGLPVRLRRRPEVSVASGRLVPSTPLTTPRGVLHRSNSRLSLPVKSTSDHTSVSRVKVVEASGATKRMVSCRTPLTTPSISRRSASVSLPVHRGNLVEATQHSSSFLPAESAASAHPGQRVVLDDRAGARAPREAPFPGRPAPRRVARGRGPRPLRLLCYGDSVTAGLYHAGAKFSQDRAYGFRPYGEVLAAAVTADGGPPCDAVTFGLSGLTGAELAVKMDDAAIPDVFGHKYKGLRHAAMSEGPWDLVLLMVGTNDLGKFESIHQILRNTNQLHRACHELGLPTIALAPSHGMFKAERDKLARLLQDWARATPEILAYYDSEEVLPRMSSNGFWEADGLHLSEAGSVELGRRMAIRVAPLLAHLANGVAAQATPLTPPRPATPRALAAAAATGPVAVATAPAFSAAAPQATPLTPPQPATLRALATATAAAAAPGPAAAATAPSFAAAAPQVGRGAGHESMLHVESSGQSWFDDRLKPFVEKREVGSRDLGMWGFHPQWAHGDAPAAVLQCERRLPVLGQLGNLIAVV